MELETPWVDYYFFFKEKGTAEMLSVATEFSWWPFIITVLVKTSTGLLYF